MKIIEIYLPMNGSDGPPFAPALFDQIERQLTEKFGGVTAHRRAPAQGRWKSAGQTQVDQVAIFEVIVDAPDREWWAHYRSELEALLSQEKVLITARDIEIL
jgi:hypothetical protein